MRGGLVRFGLAALALISIRPAAAQETVTFPSRDGTTTLTAYLARPAGDAPRPAVVLMHGCSGLLNREGRITPLYRSWARALAGRGYVTLIIDSAASRSFGQTCTPSPQRMTMFRDRPKDAYAALEYLQLKSFVQADRVALMGWSQGGATVLLSINDKSGGRPPNLARDFAAAVAFYPGACSDRFQSKPFTEVEPQSWKTQTPLLVLFGEKDNWTPFPPCDTFIAAAKARGNPVEMKSYPNAVHTFDAPFLMRTELTAYRLQDGRIPVIETDEEARADAILRTLGFLEKWLGR